MGDALRKGLHPATRVYLPRRDEPRRGEETDPQPIGRSGRSARRSGRSVDTPVVRHKLRRPLRDTDAFYDAQGQSHGGTWQLSNCGPCDGPEFRPLLHDRLHQTDTERTGPVSQTVCDETPGAEPLPARTDRYRKETGADAVSRTSRRCIHRSVETPGRSASVGNT